MYLLYILLALAVITVALTFYTYHRCFYSSGNRNEDPYLIPQNDQYSPIADHLSRCVKVMEKASFEEVRITSTDGTLLYARYYENTPGAPVQLLFHGYRSSPLRDCSGGYALGRKIGINALVVDQRAHGKSGGNTITFGIKERLDCLAWANYAAKRFGPEVPLILSGISMGAATVLMASQLELPHNVICVLADCPYDSPKDIIMKVCKDEHYPPKLVYPFVRLGASILGRFDMEETSAVEAVKKARVPLLILHGEDDRFVPCDMSRKILAACGATSALYTFPGAGHGLSYMTDPVRYEKVIIDFLFAFPVMKDFLDNSPYAREVHDGHH